MVLSFGNTALLAGALLASLLMASFAHSDSDQTPIGDAVKDLPLFDAHVHYKEPAWDEYPVSSIIELMDQSGVAMALVSSTPDEGTIMLWEYAPNRIVPELRPYHGAAGSSNWAKAEGMEDYLAGRLEAYPHEGIGEFHIHRLDTSDEPLFRKVIQMAMERGIYLHVHSGPEPIRWLYSLDPDVKIIWAHAGLGEPASEVHALMKEFPKLLADTSLREWAILGQGENLDEEWQNIIFDFQDRLMIGSDTWVNGQWDDYAEIMASNRLWLSRLPRDVAEKIAFRNAEKYFNREISMEQIGTR
ncbi:putative metal-dependent hydrolase of the TIM-barrel fold protein [Roseibium album]|nr:putative metal-dependent hydrolase of the TIM-barrel fold protein [Roseibium album]